MTGKIILPEWWFFQKNIMILSIACCAASRRIPTLAQTRFDLEVRESSSGTVANGEQAALDDTSTWHWPINNDSIEINHVALLMTI